MEDFDKMFDTGMYIVMGLATVVFIYYAFQGVL